MKTPNHRVKARIFGEGCYLRRNTVNGFFPKGGRTEALPTIAAWLKIPFDQWLSRAPAFFPPCAKRGVDGIFRPGGGRSRDEREGAKFQDAKLCQGLGGTCRKESIDHARRDAGAMACGGI